MNERWRKLTGQVEDGLTSVQLGFGLFIFVFVAALMLSVETNRPTGNVLVDILLWSAALVLAGFGVVRLARQLRAANFGAEPPTRPVSTQDLMGYFVSALAGPLLLIWFVPRLAELRPESLAELVHELRGRWVDALLVGIGALLCVLPVRALVRYVTRR